MQHFQIMYRRSRAAAALCAALILSGCAGSTTTSRDRLSTADAQPVSGLVVRSDQHAAVTWSDDGSQWYSARNDRQLNPRLAVQPWSIQWVESQLNERLRISNGRPYEHTTMRRRTYRYSPSH